MADSNLITWVSMDEFFHQFLIQMIFWSWKLWNWKISSNNRDDLLFFPGNWYFDIFNFIALDTQNNLAKSLICFKKDFWWKWSFISSFARRKIGFMNIGIINHKKSDLLLKWYPQKHFFKFLWHKKEEIKKIFWYIATPSLCDSWRITFRWNGNFHRQWFLVAWLMSLWGFTGFRL